MKTTQIRLSPEDAKALREIAAAFGYFTTRGIGAGETGNTAALLGRLAAYWRRDPVGTRAALGPLMAQLDREARNEQA